MLRAYMTQTFSVALIQHTVSGNPESLTGNLGQAGGTLEKVPTLKGHNHQIYTETKFRDAD